MTTVTLSIGPKSYTVACEAGQEAHIRALGAMIAEKYAQLGSARAPLEAQNLLFAALFMADELAEARKQLAEIPEPDTAQLEALRMDVARLATELDAAREREAALSMAAAMPAPAPSGQLVEAVAEQLEVLATRVEASATALEASATSA
jgi:cell division protein ZapA